MRNNILIPAIRRGAFFVFALALLVPVLFSTPAFAQHHDRNNRGQRPVVVPRLPPGNRTLHFRGDRFFFHHGSFYHPYRSGFRIVPPPFGARIEFLPDGYSIVHFGGRPYYFCDGVYFDYQPAEKVYVVVDKPAAAEVLTSDKISLADGSVLVGLYVGGTKSVVQFDVNGDIREIPRENILSIQFAPAKQ